MKTIKILPMLLLPSLHTHCHTSNQELLITAFELTIALPDNQLHKDFTNNMAQKRRGAYLEHKLQELDKKIEKDDAATKIQRQYRKHKAYQEIAKVIEEEERAAREELALQLLLEQKNEFMNAKNTLNELYENNI